MLFFRTIFILRSQVTMDFNIIFVFLMGISYQAILMTDTLFINCSNLCNAQSLLSEAEYQWKLDHKHILALRGIVQQPSSCGSYIEILLVLEYAPYGSLYAFLRNKDVRIPENVKLQILSGVAQAVKYLHSHLPSKNRGVHCDLKPLNILIAEKCVAKV